MFTDRLKLFSVFLAIFFILSFSYGQAQVPAPNPGEQNAVNDSAAGKSKPEAESAGKPAPAAAQQIDSIAEKTRTAGPVETAQEKPAEKPVFTPLEVMGTVTDSKTNDALANITVRVKGTSISTETGENGKFLITIPNPNATLEFSADEFARQSIALDGKTSIDIKMDKDIKTLDKMVVIGYGTSKKSNLTGSVTQVDSKQLENTADVSIEKALQGKAAGVFVSQNSGAPGKDATIRIRGVGTINNSGPLYVVDGVPTESISNLSPNDIESISILKDAPAAAIYGSRGANGVILITTKKGKEGKSEITWDAYVGIQQPWKKPKMCNGSEWWKLHKDAIRNDSAASATDSASINAYWAEDTLDSYNYSGLYAPLTTGVGTNWFDQILNKNALISSNTVSLMRGTDKLSYYLSGDITTQDGIIKGSGFQKYGLRANTENKLNDWLSIGDNLGISNLQTQHADESDEWNSLVAASLSIEPVVPLADADGNLVPSVNQQRNPLGIIKTTYDRDVTNLLEGNLFADLKIANSLKYHTSLGLNYSDFNKYFFKPTYDIGPIDQNNTNMVRRPYDQTFDWVFEHTITFEKTFADVHNFSFMVGQTVEKDSSEHLQVEITDVPSNDPSQRWPSSGTSTQPSVEGAPSVHTLLSYLGRMNYDYSGKYFISATLRRDGSSRFGPDYRYGTFPSVSGSWRISEEPFLKGNAVLNNLKLRGGWGILGNQEIGDYRFVTVASNGQKYNFADQIVNGTTFLSQGMPNIRWESQTSTNGGLDIGVLDNKLELLMDVYNKKTTDMLIQPTIPSNAGLDTAPTINGGSVSNTGFEATLNYKQEFGDFNVEAGGNISTYKNKVLSLGPTNQPIMDASVHGIALVTRTEVGHEIGEFYGYETDGLFQNQTEIDADTTASGQKVQPNAKPGDIRYKHNADGSLARGFIGSPHPLFSFGFNLDVGYKAFDVSVFLQGSVGNKIFNATRYTMDNNAATFNLDERMLHSWSGPGSTNDPNLSRMTIDNAGDNLLFSDRYVEDGSYMRVKNLQIGYTLPEEICKKLKMQKLRIYIGSENLLTITGYTGLDPEIGVGNTDAGAGAQQTGVVHSSLNYGVDRGTYPQARSIMLGINVTL
jgi:TonB-dependent starch-binding outer membrane protein SusC